MHWTRRPDTSDSTKSLLRTGAAHHIVVRGLLGVANWTAKATRPRSLPDRGNAYAMRRIGFGGDGGGSDLHLQYLLMPGSIPSQRGCSNSRRPLPCRLLKANGCASFSAHGEPVEPPLPKQSVIGVPPSKPQREGCCQEAGRGYIRRPVRPGTRGEPSGAPLDRAFGLSASCIEARSVEDPRDEQREGRPMRLRERRVRLRRSGPRIVSRGPLEVEVVARVLAG